MKLARGPGSSFPATRAAKLLIGLPLLLAAFALALQWSGPRGADQHRLVLSGLPEYALDEKPGLLSQGPLDTPGPKHREQTGFLSQPQRAARTLITTQAQEGGEGLAADGGGVGGDAESTRLQTGKVSELWRPGAGWKPQTFPNVTGPKIAFVSTTSEGFKQTRQWVMYHRVLGVTHFYLFVDGQASRPEVRAQLEELPGVVVVPRDEKLKARQARSRIWNETWLSAFFHKPCNHELFVLQSLNMEEGIQMARRDGVDWILHIDTDELVYPGGAPEFSLQSTLAALPADIDTLVFPNYESLPERDDVMDPFTEVTLFKRNYHHVVPDSYFKSYHQVARGNPNYFITYGNGKSAARMQDGLRPNGAHRWYSYNKAPKEETSDQAAVLHFTYNRFNDLKSRRDRCDCAPTEEDAKRCFILPFDRMAFLAASMKTDDELEGWFRDRLVWSDPAVVVDLLKSGLFVRIYDAQIVMRGYLTAEDESSRQQAGRQAYPEPGTASAGLSLLQPKPVGDS